jgi:hypothetical protein
MAIKYTNIFHSKVLKNTPKLGFFGLKIYHLATLNGNKSFFKTSKQIKLKKSLATRKNIKVINFIQKLFRLERQ